MKPRASTTKRGASAFQRPDPVDTRTRNQSARLGTPSSPTNARAPIRLIALNKPYGVICQFTKDGAHPTLADFIPIPEVYPAGRLDTDSEGLLLLTNFGPLQNWISSPAKKHSQPLPKTYWAQVEGIPGPQALAELAAPLDLGDFVSRAASARSIAEPATLWPRQPPIRQRAAIPTSWLEITISEGKNRQVRRMTAKVGFPTLRLIRHAIGPISLNGLAPGRWRDVDLAEIGYKR